MPSFKADNSADYGLYGKALFHISQMDKLREDTKEFPQDIEYRKNILKNIGLTPEDQYKIRSIIGPQELKSIMSEFNEDELNYTSGEDLENVFNYGIRANLHMHTVASDGSLSAKELLEKATRYADDSVRNNPNAKKVPFVVAITDHDTLESSQEVIRTIYENPMKYRNLRVVLGIEVTTYNNIATDLVNKPTNTHVLVYGVDPNEKTFQSFVNGIKSKKLDMEVSAMETANKTYQKYYGKDDFFNLPQAKAQFNQLNKNITGIYNNLDMYFRNKIAVEHIILKNDKIKNKLQKYNMPTTTDEFMDKFSEFKFVLDRNNKVYPPEVTLPEFISNCTDMNKEEVAKIVSDGLKEEKVAQLTKELKSNISQYKVTLNHQCEYMPTFETLYDGLKDQNQVIIGLAHPLDTTAHVKDKGDKYKFLEDLYSKFTNSCKEKAAFSEVYYQSYTGDSKSFKADSDTKQFMNEISQKYNLFKTGSQDTHSRNIFKR